MIALIGAHRATKLLAPYQDPAWEVWGCSDKNESELPRQEVWFEIHHPDIIAENKVYCDWLRGLPHLFMQETYPEFPNAVAYPLQLVLDEFGPYFFTGTISYMLAAAILKRPAKIGFWGISNCPEFSHQQASILHFVQVARDRGIEVISPAFPALLSDPPLYGFDRNWRKS